MMRRFLRAGVTGAFMAALTSPAMGGGPPEYEGECVMGLALGKHIKTDCSVNTVLEGKTYCFGNEQAKAIFLKKPEEFLAKAQTFYALPQPLAQP
jgi:YHS domain-containing protein